MNNALLISTSFESESTEFNLKSHIHAEEDKLLKEVIQSNPLWS